MPDGTRWNFHSRRPRTIVWPALLPPWKRTTASARSASRSVILPLPSSPHWSRTITMPGLEGSLRGRSVDDVACVAATEGQRLAAHPPKARDDPLPELLGDL